MQRTFNYLASLGFGSGVIHYEISSIRRKGSLIGIRWKEDRHVALEFGGREAVDGRLPNPQSLDLLPAVPVSAVRFEPPTSILREPSAFRGRSLPSSCTWTLT